MYNENISRKNAQGVQMIRRALLNNSSVRGSRQSQPLVCQKNGTTLPWRLFALLNTGTTHLLFVIVQELYISSPKKNVFDKQMDS